jgi:hypothetical protein
MSCLAISGGSKKDVCLACEIERGLCCTFFFRSGKKKGQHCNGSHEKKNCPSRLKYKKRKEAVRLMSEMINNLFLEDEAFIELLQDFRLSSPTSEEVQDTIDELDLLFVEGLNKAMGEEEEN